MELEMRIVKKVAAAAMAMAVVFGAASLKPVAANAAQAEPETASVMEEENSFLSHQDEAYQNEFLRRVNSERAKAGLKPVQLGDSSHNSAAQERAKELASSYSYVRPNGQRDFTVFAENGIEDVSIGEDYMAGVSTPDAAVDQWMNIDFTRERILNADATTMSVGHYEGGVYNNYWVLIFSYPENSYTSDYRQRVLDLVNAERANYGLQPLVMGDAKLTAAAQHRAEVRPNGQRDFTVFAENGIEDVSIGEDYMAGVSTPDAAVDQWMNIDFTRERILNADATTMSVGHYEGGVYNNYWVLIFSYPENSYTSDYRQRVLDLVNAERANYGLQPLVMGDAKLTAAAQHRAEEIATVNSHVRPNGSKWYTVLSEYGVTDAASGENAAWGSVSPEEVVTAWMNSEGHRANILDPEARAMGVGYYYNSSSTWGHQWIQLFTK